MAIRENGERDFALTQRRERIAVDIDEGFEVPTKV